MESRLSTRLLVRLRSLTPSGNTITIASTGTIGGSIATNQIAFGSGANTIQGSNNLTYTSGKFNLQDTAAILTPLATETISGNGSGGTAWLQPALQEIIANTDGEWLTVATNAAGTGNSGSSRGTWIGEYLLSASNGNQGGFQYYVGGVLKAQIQFGGAGVGVQLGTNNSDTTITAIRCVSNAGIQLFTDTGFQVELMLGTALKFDGSSSGFAILGVAASAGSPNRINLPTTTGTNGQVLTTDGANPQQTSWTTPGGGTSLIASGSATLASTAIPSVTAATVVTVAAVGVLTTDSIEWAFNATPGAGYTSGLHVLAFVSTDAVNFSVVNPTAGALTPAIAVLNWRVIR